MGEYFQFCYSDFLALRRRHFHREWKQLRAIVKQAQWTEQSTFVLGARGVLSTFENVLRPSAGRERGTRMLHHSFAEIFLRKRRMSGDIRTSNYAMNCGRQKYFSV